MEMEMEMEMKFKMKIEITELPPFRDIHSESRVPPVN